MTIVLGIVNEGKLIPQEMWIKFISSLENNFDDLETNNERSKRVIAEKLVEAVRKRIVPKFGILFSGGVDSTLIAFIAKKLKCNFSCYTIGIENSDDVAWAQRISEEYGLNFRYQILSLEQFENVLEETIKVLNDADIVKASVGSVLFSGGKLALADNNNILFGGLGSEEIFAGYQRHAEALQNNDYEALHKECWSGLKNMWKRDLIRDFTIAKYLGLELRTPFLDKELMMAAMNVHPMYKVDKEHKKFILREAAELIGLKKEFAWRKKKAAQYGSNFVNGIQKLSKKYGFKTKKEYLESLLVK